MGGHREAWRESQPKTSQVGIDGRVGLVGLLGKLTLFVLLTELIKQHLPPVLDPYNLIHIIYFRYLQGKA